jgi:hypothetical protein
LEDNPFRALIVNRGGKYVSLYGLLNTTTKGARSATRLVSEGAPVIHLDAAASTNVHGGVEQYFRIRSLITRATSRTTTEVADEIS